MGWFMDREGAQSVREALGLAPAASQSYLFIADEPGPSQRADPGWLPAGTHVICGDCHSRAFGWRRCVGCPRLPNPPEKTES